MTDDEGRLTINPENLYERLVDLLGKSELEARFDDFVQDLGESPELICDDKHNRMYMFSRPLSYACLVESTDSSGKTVLWVLIVAVPNLQGGYMAKILAFAGSLRTGSFNKKLVKIAADGAREQGADVTVIDLKDYPLPVYDGDIEAQGIPENAMKLKKLMGEADAILIASPEYNSSISGALKNTIDWISRPAPGEGLVANFRGKIAGIMAASPGALGGLRGLVTVRSILENIFVMVIPEQIAIPMAMEAFTEDGALKDAKQQEQVKQIGRRVAEVAEKLRAEALAGSQSR